MLFDNGAGSSPTGTSSAGDPYPGFEKDFSSFPIPGTTAQTWYLGPQGTLANQPPAKRGHQLVHLERQRTPTHRLREQHW